MVTATVLAVGNWRYGTSPMRSTQCKTTRRQHIGDFKSGIRIGGIYLLKGCTLWARTSIRVPEATCIEPPGMLIIGSSEIALSREGMYSEGTDLIDVLRLSPIQTRNPRFLAFQFSRASTCR